LFHKALEVSQRLLGEDDPDIASYNSLAALYSAQPIQAKNGPVFTLDTLD
jgi:hypothetical protein